MARQRSRVRVISVEPVNRNDRNHILTYEESQSSKTTIDNGERKQSVRDLTLNSDKEDNIGLPGEIITVKPDNKGLDEDIIKHSEDRYQPKEDVIDDVTKDSSDQASVTASGSEDTSTQCEIVSNKKDAKKNKKKKKKEKKEQNIESVVKKGSGTEETGGADNNQDADDTGTSGKNVQTDAGAIEPDQKGKKSRKLPCCFGFISTWIAKRKERRREKKRKAIEARKSKTPVEPLVEYEHKKSRGGVAFTVEVDSRPVRKPVLPPIQQRPGPIMLGTDERLQNAEIKRAEHLEKKKKSSHEHAKKRAECIERKEESEFYFKKKAHLTIRYRQADAERNRKRYQDEQRSSSSMLLRAPSTLPPLEKVYLKPSAAANMEEVQAIVSDSEESVEEFFDF